MGNASVSRLLQGQGEQAPQEIEEHVHCADRVELRVIGREFSEIPALRPVRRIRSAGMGQGWKGAINGRAGLDASTLTGSAPYASLIPRDYHSGPV